VADPSAIAAKSYPWHKPDCVDRIRLGDAFCLLRWLLYSIRAGDEVIPDMETSHFVAGPGSPWEHCPNSAAVKPREQLGEVQLAIRGGIKGYKRCGELSDQVANSLADGCGSKISLVVAHGAEPEAHAGTDFRFGHGLLSSLAPPH
jgi:hypothetical protein